MNCNTRKTILCLAGALLAVSAVRVTALAPIEEDTEKLYERAAEIMADNLPRTHLNRLDIDDTVASNAVEHLLRSLDFDRSVFRADDVRQFRERANTLDNELRSGQITFALQVYRRFMQRLSNRIDYAETLLAEPFDFTKDETYRWKRKDAPWAEDEDAWNELWRKKIKNMILARKVAKSLDAEEAENEEDTESDAEEDASDHTEEITPEEAILKDFRQRYMVLQDNDAHWLYTLYLTAFTRAFDPHSDYMSKNNTEDFDINMKLQLVGIGALLGAEDGAAKIIRLIPGGPAMRDGRLQAGDKIVAVGQGDEEPVDILHRPLSEIVRLIRGEIDTKVVLTVIPASDSSGTTTVNIDLIRDEVQLNDRAAKGETLPLPGSDDGKVGVITIPDFYGDILGKRRGEAGARSVTDDVEELLIGMMSNGVEGILVDLRNNGGGALNEAIEMTGLFIESGPVVQVRSRRGVRIMSDADPKVVYRGPLVVLVNRLSASASEIFAGALKDYGRAVIVGDTKTHGKGTVQALLSLHRFKDELGSLKLSTASFYRVNGASTQREGIAPHIVIPSILDYMEIGEEYLPHALPWTEIRPAYYPVMDDVNPWIETLREASVNRRKQDERFLRYRELLDYLGEEQQNKTISLNFDKRLETARRRRHMNELLKTRTPGDPALEAEPETDEDEETVPTDDIILDEALHILSDLAHVSSSLTRPVAAHTEN